MSQILLIEPDYVLAKTYKRVLEKEGHSVSISINAQSAVFVADNQTPDLVIMELQLIEHSGIEFIYEFRSYTEWQDIPIIVQTHIPAGEFTGSWDILKRELDVRAYLYKPQTKLSDLIAAVNELNYQVS